jgi:hypothetical protein
MQTSKSEQMVGRVSDAVRPVLCLACGLRQTVPTASGSDVGSDSQIPQRTDPRGGIGLSQGDLLETSLSPVEREIAALALSYPHLFGEWA